jgi:hypothetical protein
MVVSIPWIDPFLQQVQEEYSKAPPTHRLIEPEETSFEYVYSVVKEKDPFDTAGLKLECVEALRQNKATLLQSVSSQGTILVVSLHKSPIQPTWNLWWRSIRLLIPPSKQVRILLFAHPSKRHVPSRHRSIEKEHVNGGAAYRCDPMSIVLYRKEEVSRVLIHELFHASCSDPYHLDTPHIEADTEAWAELVLCAMAAKGVETLFYQTMKQQIAWALQQAATIQKYHNVHTEQEYAWRYLIGRLDVWRSLGFIIPAIPTQFKQVRSLRFSICEPHDI